MTSVDKEARAFKDSVRKRQADAHQRVALFLVCGIDLADALHATGSERATLQRRLKRLVERERLKGARGHWSYDLNRHIALGQALMRLEEADGAPAAGTARRPCGRQRMPRLSPARPAARTG